MVTVSEVKEQYNEVEKSKFWTKASIRYTKRIECDSMLVRFGEYNDGVLNINYFLHIIEDDGSTIYGGFKNDF